MKRLIVMRHAKSSWTSDAPNDHARPLNKRGRRDAPRMGRELSDRGWVPELVLSSDSQRTRETWAGVATEMGDDIDVQFTKDLYHGGSREVRDLCGELVGPHTVLVLGHNPGWEDVVGYLTGESPTMTTANCALLEAGGEWADLMKSSAWQLVDVLRPKELD